MLLIYLLLFYFVFVWIILRLIVPFLGFSKPSVPEKIPVGLQNKIDEWNKNALDKRQFLELAYGFVTETFTGSRIKTITQFWKVFQDPLLASPGFLPCTSQNFLLRTILIKSDRFIESDIEVKVTPLNFFIHQYLRVNTGDALIDVDPWSNFLGLSLGEKSAIFG